MHTLLVFLKRDQLLWSFDRALEFHLSLKGQNVLSSRKKSGGIEYEHEIFIGQSEPQ